ncbi:putative ATP-dependent RNA helicase ddx49 [Kappamyces sp. JEL0829]|nr:putative ATP-dependent RNA helicase ddx49 [Kappamyces sp. JEL0829]
MDWNALEVKTWLQNALLVLGIKAPTEIQTKAIPAILKGKDVIASAITELGVDPFGVFGLVLTPTRELAFQIAEQFRIGLKVSVVVGGMDMMTQALELAQKPHIVIATPGRLADHIVSSSQAIHFKRLRFLVLDEADRLLEEGFRSELDTIFSTLPKKNRQTLLFTATMTEEIEALTFAPGRIPEVVATSERFETVDKLDQKYLFIPSTVREAYLAHIMENDFAEKTAIIFAGKPKTCEILRLMLKELGIRSTALHSYMTQADRIGSLAKFKSGIVPVLISTDVGSRGLDIPTVQVVINYQLPADPADYVHRIGRTARAGRDGLSVSLVTERDVDLVHTIEARTGRKMTEFDVQENPVLEILDKVNLAKRQAGMLLMEMDFGGREKIRQEKRSANGAGEKKKRGVGKR